jgi:hypothetical protein
MSAPGHTRATGNGSRVVLGLVDNPGVDLLNEPSERLGDGLVPVSGRVLIDQRGARTRMAEPGHQLFETGTRSRGQCSADMS